MLICDSTVGRLGIIKIQLCIGGGEHLRFLKNYLSPPNHNNQPPNNKRMRFNHRMRSFQDFILLME